MCIRDSICTVRSFEEAERTVLALQAEGFGAVELCGAFGPERAERLTRLTGGAMAIGYVTHDPAPVSYTHLDVYKRQDPGSVSAVPVPVCPGGVHPESGQHAAGVPPAAPLDVYKRQLYNGMRRGFP